VEWRREEKISGKVLGESVGAGEGVDEMGKEGIRSGPLGPVAVFQPPIVTPVILAMLPASPS
jgi:hypothetical protein